MKTKLWKTNTTKHSPVKQMKMTMPYCQISCVKSVLKRKFPHELVGRPWKFCFLLISLVSFGANDFRRCVREPLVPPLHHRVHLLRLAEVAQLDTREIRAEDQNVVELHVTVANFSALSQGEKRKKLVRKVLLANWFHYTLNACTREQLRFVLPRASNEAPRCHYQKRLMSNRLKQREPRRIFNWTFVKLIILRSSPKGAYSCVKT